MVSGCHLGLPICAKIRCRGINVLLLGFGGDGGSPQNTPMPNKSWYFCVYFFFLSKIGFGANFGLVWPIGESEGLVWPLTFYFLTKQKGNEVGSSVQSRIAPVMATSIG